MMSQTRDLPPVFATLLPKFFFALPKAPSWVLIKELSVDFDS
jgi:hypothetical protein